MPKGCLGGLPRGRKGLHKGLSKGLPEAEGSVSALYFSRVQTGTMTWRTMRRWAGRGTPTPCASLCSTAACSTSGGWLVSGGWLCAHLVDGCVHPAGCVYIRWVACASVEWRVGGKGSSGWVPLLLQRTRGQVASQGGTDTTPTGNHVTNRCCTPAAWLSLTGPPRQLPSC